jgi:hypothetical protein
VLINEYNDTLEALENIFKLTKDVGARMVFFRPTIIEGVAYAISDVTKESIKLLSEKYSVAYKMNLAKYMPRNYKKCHQMFQFPIFSANGKIYICCEGKGNPQFELGSWDEGDFRDIWLNKRHYEIYEKTRVEFCQPCRPNINNINIQNILNNPITIETLYQ